MSDYSQKIRVGVLRGGISPEYKVSLETGKNVLQNLPEEYYLPVDIFISRSGAWHEGGMEKSPEKILKRVDVVWNALHGAYGEDGTVQKVLDNIGTPYTGSGAMPSAMGMNKILSKKIYRDNGLKTPFGISISHPDLTRALIRQVYEEVPMPFVVKPASAGSSVGVFVVHSLPELEEAIIAAFEYSPQVLVEEFIKGKEATAGVIDKFRDQEYYSLPPVEIRYGQDFFDYNSKYADSATEEICPGNFTPAESLAIREMAARAHQSLGLRHYSRSDFRVHPTRGIFILETNTLPGLTAASLIPKSLTAVGSRLSDFLHHVLELALKRK